jgi:hypothetical protein
LAEMTLWAQLDSEVAVTEDQADLLVTRVNNILTRRTASLVTLSAFQDFVFDDARAVREAINKGHRTIRELLPILSQARKFHGWLSSKGPEVNLLKEYHREVTAVTWIDKLPTKTARWAIFTGAGIGIDALGAGGIGTAFGVALSAMDQFFLDKIAKGWKPHHFVNSLEEFVRR